MSTDGGSISPAGRFQRMEDALERIENKLDAKADLVRLEALERHLSDLETGRVMSPSNQQLMTSFQNSLKDIAQLKSDQAVREASAVAEKNAIREIADARFAYIRTLVSIATIVNAVIVAGVTLLSMFNVI